MELQHGMHIHLLGLNTKFLVLDFLLAIILRSNDAMEMASQVTGYGFKQTNVSRWILITTALQTKKQPDIT